MMTIDAPPPTHPPSPTSYRLVVRPLVIDTRPTDQQLRTTRLGRVVFTRPQTRSPSPSLTEFREAARRFFHARHPARSELAAALVQDIRASRYPDECVNILVDEAVNRGGPDGLDMAAGVLAKVPAALERVIGSLFRSDSVRRAKDRRLGYPRYRATDEIWSVLLDALARTDPTDVPTAAVLATLRRVERSATDGMREGLTIAATELADRGETDKRKALAFLNRMLTRTGVNPLSANARRAIEGAIADLEG
jgi:hypothetical protein